MRSYQIKKHELKRTHILALFQNKKIDEKGTLHLGRIYEGKKKASMRKYGNCQNERMHKKYKEFCTLKCGWNPTSNG
jgi:hypothetical protein